MVGGPHCFWNFSQAPQTLDLGPKPGLLPLTHPYCIPALLNGSVHPARQPKPDLPRCHLYLHSVHPPSPISMSPRPPYNSPLCLPSSIHCHLTGLEPCSSALSGLPQLCPHLSNLSYLTAVWGISPFLKIPSRLPTTLRLKPTLSNLLTESLGLSLILNLDSTGTEFPAPPPTLPCRCLRAFQHSVPSAWKVSIPSLFTLEPLLILQDAT